MKATFITGRFFRMKTIDGKFIVAPFKPRRTTQDRLTSKALTLREQARTAVQDKLEMMRIEKEYAL